MATLTTDTIGLLDPLANPDQKRIIDQILEDNRSLPGATMVILNELQGRIGFVSPSMQTYVAKQLHVPVSAIHGVISFYSFFSTIPRGKYTIMACMGTACYVRGAEQVVEAFEKELGIQRGQTSKDGLFSLKCVRCLGACGMAPVVMIGEDVHSKIKPNTVKKIIRQYS
jgi:NADH-quinone oxidoreductase subunit E